MENVYEIRRKYKLNIVLSDEIRNNPNTIIQKGQMAVIVHLHYIDTVEFFFQMLKNVPKCIDIYVSTSERITKEKIISYIKKYEMNNCYVIDKENRGRDISSLLVACKKVIERYEFFCFLHDKKGKHKFDQEYKWEWVISMWNNMIASEEYIYNVKNVFDIREDVGILAVPEPFDIKNVTAFDNTWYENFEQTKELAERLQLNCELDYNIPPITLGSVFWCRKKALAKLLDYPWKYEDFDEEPMKNDGTISHAIERIFAYVAQDAGYLTGNIRTIPYAEQNIEDMQYYLRLSHEHLKRRMGIWNFDNLLHYDERKERCISFANQYKEIYIYGAGKGGQQCVYMLEEAGIIPKAVLVTDKAEEQDKFCGLPIMKFDPTTIEMTAGIIVAVGERFCGEIIEKLEANQLNNYIWMMK